MIDFLLTQKIEIISRALEHLVLTSLPLMIVILFGVPLGLYLTRFPRRAKTVIEALSFLQTLPILAVLAIIFLISGSGTHGAIFALTLYCFLPIVSKTFTGITTIDPDLRETAMALGMSDSEVLTQVELPLATPAIFSGVRTATLLSVGIATLTAMMGAGGLGHLIFEGLRESNSLKILTGAVLVALLATALNLGLSVLEKWVSTWLRPLWGLSLLVLCFLSTLLPWLLNLLRT
jgi:osmoprotectant transport system permease protein